MQVREAGQEHSQAGSDVWKGQQRYYRNLAWGRSK